MSTSNPHVYVSPVSGEHPPHHEIGALRNDFEKVVEGGVHCNDDAVVAMPREGQPITRVAMRADEGIYMTRHPQNLQISTDAAATLESMMAEWYSHYPIEPTLARTKFGVPMLYTRFDGTINPDGTIGLCEFDDVPTGINALRQINPATTPYIDAVVRQLGGPLVSVLMEEPGYTYPHDDDLWLPSVHPDMELAPGTAVVPRARRNAPGFGSFMDRYGEASVLAGWERDNKGPLIAMGLGVLAANLELVLELAEEVKQDQPIFMKGLLSSRTEAAGVIASNKWSIKGKSSAGQMRRKFEASGIRPDEDFPIVIQPFHRPPTMAELGLEFNADDATTLQSFSCDARNTTGAELAIPGNEEKYHVLSRVYGVYTPELGHKIIGGFWMARPNAAIIHGSSDAITGSLDVEGLSPYST